MLQENYIDLKKINTERRFTFTLLIFSTNFENEIQVLYALRFSYSPLIEINNLNFSPISSFTSEGHDRASFPIEARSTTRKTPFYRYIILPFFFFFSNSIPFRTTQNAPFLTKSFFPSRNLFRLAHASQKFAYVDSKTLEKEEWENYPSGSVSAPWYLKAIRPIVTQRDKFEVRRLAWRTWHGWIRSNCVMPFWHRVIIKTFHLGRHIASRCSWTDPLARPFAIYIRDKLAILFELLNSSYATVT